MALGSVSRVVAPSGVVRDASWITASAARNAVWQAVAAAASSASRRWATRTRWTPVAIVRLCSRSAARVRSPPTTRPVAQGLGSDHGEFDLAAADAFAATAKALPVG